MNKKWKSIAFWSVCGLISFGVVRAGDDFARVDGEAISLEEFERFVYAEARQTFYHGAPRGDQAIIEFRRKSADKLIDRKLKIREAKRLGLAPDAVAINDELRGYEARFGETERWQAEGESMLRDIRTWLEDESLLEQVDARLREVADPDESVLQEFYARNPDKFTRPEQLRVAVIVLGVSPSAGGEAWEGAKEEARAIILQLQGGADFANLAGERSDDVTASDGGDMGWIHAGVLGPDVQAALEELDVGEVTAEPVRVLEGVVIARLEAIRPARVIDLAEARERALTLYREEMSEAAYENAMRQLRAASEIWVDETHLQEVASR